MKKNVSFHFLKPALVCLLALLISQVDALAGIDTDIAQTNQVILSSGPWKPSRADVQKAIAASQSFLEDPASTNDWAKREIKKILGHAKEYRVQFVGIVRDGRRLIWCNFFPAREGEFEYWKQEEVRVMDGGFWFWQIEYEPSTGKCLNFTSNGYA